MKIAIYKGFDPSFLSQIKHNPVIDTSNEDKIQITKFDSSYTKALRRNLLNLDEEIEDEVWMTYQEFLLVKDQILQSYDEGDFDLEIINNNILLGYSVILDKDSSPNFQELLEISIDKKSENNDINFKFLNFYSDFYQAGDKTFGYLKSFDRYQRVKTKDYYSDDLKITETDCPCNNHIYLNDDMGSFLNFVSSNFYEYPVCVSFQTVEERITERMLSALKAWANLHSVKLEKLVEEVKESFPVSGELTEIAQNDLHIPSFSGFRELTVYKRPELNRETVKVSQAQIISEIIEQSEISYNEDYTARDIFITAPTGSGKSLMFQIPAVYLAKHYGKLTLVIEPIKALMQDQVEQMRMRGYSRVETFNSDLISQREKEKALHRIKNGEVDLLYVSPETLLSYSIETLIGDREIGLIIIDEAHIVTTWGMDFRPDYWYLGKFLQNIRSGKRGGHEIRKRTNCIVCACTATAVNGGPNDTVNDIINSLSMVNPIKYLGYVKREDISFKINNFILSDQGTSHIEEKNRVFNEQICQFINENEKTLVYFPFKSQLAEAKSESGNFKDVTYDSNEIAIYAGSISYDAEADRKIKQESFENFRAGIQPIMFATKAFGMGVDIKDIKNVYHYAPTGGLSDYIQEIGRVAREVGMRGYAITDYFKGDLSYSLRLRGMSQIREYQIKQLLSGLYEVYRSKGERRNFLISPESFTYIFNGKKSQDSAAINKLKIALLMLEKDLYDKNNYKVLVTRPRGIFTKAFVVIDRKIETMVLGSDVGCFFRKIANGRYKERSVLNGTISDVGDIYEADLKGIWEQFYPDLSFPSFKYFFFKKIRNFEPGKTIGQYLVLPKFLDGIYSRQKIDIILKKGERLKLYP